MRRATFGILLLIGTTFSAGCDNTLENLPTTPPPAPTTTDEFTGTINRNGAATHTFPVSASGTVTATLTEVLPNPEIAVGFSMGTWNGVSCQSVISLDAAVQGNVITGNVTGFGTLCVRVHDNGRLEEAIEYKLTVVHP